MLKSHVNQLCRGKKTILLLSEAITNLEISGWGSLPWFHFLKAFLTFLPQFCSLCTKETGQEIRGFWESWNLQLIFIMQFILHESAWGMPYCVRSSEIRSLLIETGLLGLLPCNKSRTKCIPQFFATSWPLIIMQVSFWTHQSSNSCWTVASFWIAVICI